MPISRQKQIEGSETKHFVSERKKRGKEEVNLQPPLTPMIDVTFQLLLYFILTAQFLEDEGQIPGSLPQAGITSAASEILRPVTIRIRATGRENDSCQFEVDSLAPIEDPKELQEVLKGRKQVSQGKAPVVIRPWGSVRWKFVVEAFNAAVVAKFENIGFGGAG